MGYFFYLGSCCSFKILFGIEYNLPVEYILYIPSFTFHIPLQPSLGNRRDGEGYKEGNRRDGEGYKEGKNRRDREGYKEGKNRRDGEGYTVKRRIEEMEKVIRRRTEEMEKVIL